MIYANEHMVDLLNEQYEKVKALETKIAMLEKELEECDCE